MRHVHRNLHMIHMIHGTSDSSICIIYTHMHSYHTCITHMHTHTYSTDKNVKNKICMYASKGVFKGGVQGVQTPPEIFRFFFGKVKEKRWKEKEKKGMLGGGGLPLNIFLGLIFFRVGLRYFQGGLRNYRGVEKFSWGVEKFSGGGLRNFRGGLRNFRGGLRNFRGGG